MRCTDGGTLKIEVSSAELDGNDAAAHADVRPGRYTLITMTDTGTGMSEEVQERAFEPFFTTKDVGSGTGLGLSTVYGFVKQSGGHVTLEGVPGRVPPSASSCPAANEDSDGRGSNSPWADPPCRGRRARRSLSWKTEARVRRITVARLEELGYAVLEAGGGPEALDVLARNPTIDLVFTDIVMPGGMSGAELAAKVHESRPDIPVLLTSGYAEPDLIRQAGPSGSNWLKKPLFGRRHGMETARGPRASVFPR